MAGSPLDEEDQITGINVTPLVDVVLVLLVIFMVTANYIVHSSINIKLPTAATGQTQAREKSLSFTLDRDSKLYLDGKLLTYPDLSSAIEARKKGAKLKAIISADKSVSHGEVVKLIDAVRKLGITNFAVDVEASSL